MSQLGSAPFASTRRRRRDGGAFSPLALFGAGEAGGWWDPSDLTPEKVSWRRNRALWTQEFSNAAYAVNAGATVTSDNAIAPDGTQTADTIAFTTTGYRYQPVTIGSSVAGRTFTASVWMWSATKATMTLRLCGNTTGSDQVRQQFALTSTPTRYSVTRTFTATDTIIDFGFDNRTSSGGDGIAGDVIAWGFQVEEASTASSYQRITDFTSDFLAAFPQHALYQDSTGTTPVTALGQPVGLVLDKSKGGLASLGPELVTNGGPFSNTTGWSGAASATVSVVGDKLRITRGATAGVQSASFQYAGAVVGAWYEMVMVVSSNTTGLSLTLQSYGNSVLGNSTTSGSITTYRVKYVADRTNPFVIIRLETGSTSDFVEIASVSVKAVPGSHLIQATSASRPTCDARVNLLTYSEQFENAAWTKQDATITANASVAPNGTTTADRLIENTANAQHLTLQNFTFAAASYTFSVYIAKASTRNAMVFMYNGSGGGVWAGAEVNIANGTATVFSGSLAGTAVRVVDEGLFWRASVSATMPAAAGYCAVYMLNGTANSYTGNGTSYLDLWGADLRISSDASLPYQRVVTASDYADVNAPRYLTCDGVDDSLYTAASVDFATWTSGTRRNLLTYPSAFDNTVWTKVSANVTANNVVAPDGTTTGDTVAATATGVGARIQQDITVSTTGQYVYSCYLRRDNVNTAVLRIFNNTSSTNLAEVTFNVQNGTVSSTVVGSGAITNVGNGWYRCEVTHTGSVTSSNSIRVYVYPNNTSPTNGDAVATWGAQLELGSTATSFQDVGTDKMTVVTGVRKLSDAAFQVIAETGASVDAEPTAFAVLGANTVGYYHQTGVSGDRVFGTGTAFSTAAPITNVVTALFDRGLTTVSEIQYRINGNGPSSAGLTLQGAGATGNFGTLVLNVGRRNNASLPFNGRIYQLIVRGAQTDTATVQQTERFVAGKTGIAI